MNAASNLIEKIISRATQKKPVVREERRRAKRCRIDLPVRFEIYLPSRPDVSSPMLSAQMFDLSELGMGMLTNTLEYDGLHMIDPDPETSEQCLLKILIPCSREPIKLTGKVEWFLQEQDQGYTFRVGIRFLNLTPEKKQSILNYIEIYRCANDLPAPGLDPGVLNRCPA